MFKVYFVRFLLLIFYLIPINRKKIFFSSYEGKKISCNPKYIYEVLKNKNYKFVWEYNFDDLSDSDKITYVKHNSLKYIFSIMTSSVIITNSGLSAIFPIRKKQMVINTWHGSGAYKRVGKDISQEINGTSNDRQQLMNKQTTYFISGCKKFTEVMSSAIGLEKEKFLEIGMPRNSIMFKNNDINEIKNKLGLSKFDKICLYAPTFRGATNNVKSDSSCLDVDLLKNSLKERFGGDWTILYRGHYLDLNAKNEKMIDASSYDDMQELLLASDVLITDYSSSIWDYSFLYRPCFLFCYDLADYKEERNFYVPINDWGFPVVQDNNELSSAILNFNEECFKNNMIKHHKDLGSVENEESAIKIAEKIIHFVEIGEK